MISVFLPQLRRLAIGVAVLGGLSQAIAAPSAEPTPPAVKIIATPEGPAFATRDGKALYSTPIDDLTPGKPTCDGSRLKTAVHMGEEYPLPLRERRKTCIEKWPPFVASAGAAPIGRWTIVKRPDGIVQWAHDGKLLYTSIRDLARGGINGAADRTWRLATPDIGLPAGVALKNILEGLALVRQEGASEAQLLFTARDKTVDPEGWEPLDAPASATQQDRDWTIRHRADGRTQWVFRGGPLYYATITTPEDSGQLLAPVLFQKGDATPSRFAMRHTIVGSVFVDESGKTLYSFSCNEQTIVALSCDLAGDPAIYRASMCGTSERCAKQWLPVVARVGEKSAGEWSIIDFPYPAFADPAGAVGDGVPIERLWAFRGRPVYTFNEDEEPGETRGHGMRWFGPSRYDAVKVPGSDVFVGEQSWAIASGSVKIAEMPTQMAVAPSGSQEH